MKRFTNILFIYDPAYTADSAFERALKLAKKNSAHLTIASVYPVIPRTLEKIQDAFIRIQENLLNNFKARFDTDDVELSSSVWVGTPFLQIIRGVEKAGYDLVIKSAEGSESIGNMLFGSTDMHLLRKCPCPVWIIKPSQAQHFKRIIAAVDIDPSEPANAELNQLILELATSITRSDNGELHIVHAWNLAYEDTLRTHLGELPEVDIENLLNYTKKEHRDQLDALLHERDLDGIPTFIHLLKGEPGQVIPSLAAEKKAELIVMGTVARTGIKGFFIGNTAERILSAINCSIIAVKPKSFSTPV